METSVSRIYGGNYNEIDSQLKKIFAETYGNDGTHNLIIHMILHKINPVYGDNIYHSKYFTDEKNAVYYDSSYYCEHIHSRYPNMVHIEIALFNLIENIDFKCGKYKYIISYHIGIKKNNIRIWDTNIPCKFICVWDNGRHIPPEWYFVSYDHINNYHEFKHDKIKYTSFKYVERAYNIKPPKKNLLIMIITSKKQDKWLPIEIWDYIYYNFIMCHI